MYGTFYNPGNKMVKYQKDSSRRTQETFQAYVDAVIPRTPGLAEEFGRIQFFGALNLHTDEYVMLSLNYYYIPMAEPTAEMLDVAAEQLVIMDANKSLVNFSRFMGGSAFAAIDHNDRFRAITLLEQLNIYLADLPIPFQGNSELILYTTSSLNRFTMMGYYSEWSGYGSTRLETPNQRILEYHPLSWKQIGYPGPSLGYRVLRKGDLYER